MPAEGHPHQPRRNKDGNYIKQKFVGVSVCNLMALLLSIKVRCNSYFSIRVPSSCYYAIEITLLGMGQEYSILCMSH